MVGDNLLVAGTDIIVVGALVVLFAVQLLTSSDPLGRSLDLLLQFRKQEKKLTSGSNVDVAIENYNSLQNDDKNSVKDRNQEYKKLVNTYYDLVTLFFEWGWSTSFHFCYQYSFETFNEAMRRHEYILASKLNIFASSSSKKVLDVGCGIGGPMRNIGRFWGANSNINITGLTLNQYQVDRGNRLTSMDPTLARTRRSVQGDFMKMPFADQEFDAAYAIEATCHAPNRIDVYKEIYRVLKPGAHFANYEWCMTDQFDPTNETHLRYKKQIETGNGLPDLVHTSVCLEALEAAGFEIVEQRDLALDDVGPGGKPWYQYILPSWNPTTQRFQFNWFGSRLVNNTFWLLEWLYLAPKGSYKTQRMLQTGIVGLGGAGTTQIFTPMFLIVGRKKEKSE